MSIVPSFSTSPLDVGRNVSAEVAFRCLLRSDSKFVIRALQPAARILMLTGDAPRTAAWVAQAVSLVTKPLCQLVLSPSGAPVWDPPAPAGTSRSTGRGGSGRSTPPRQ